MEQYVIRGGNPLVGEVEIGGAKNAALAILTAAIMTDETVVIENLPDVSDINVLLEAIAEIGATIDRTDRHTVRINASTIGDLSVDYEYIKKIRASYYLLGALLGKYKKAEVPLPGGCNIGSRPIDQHIKGFEAMGAMVEQSGGYVTCDAPEGGLQGGHVYLDIVSVGATMNILLAATLASGMTIIENCAKEPHIVDLANFLNAMGARISGAGTDVIKVRGVPQLRGGTYSIIPDQIEAGTYMAAVAACGGEVKICNIIPKHMDCITSKLQEMGASIINYDDAIRIRSTGKLHHTTVKTRPYPGFPTDMQAQICVCMTLASGISRLTENVYETRFFGYCTELQSMGANILITGKTATVTGTKQLTGATVCAHDLRAGAALIIAGLAAQGTTVVENIHFVERGYERLVEKLTALGAHIRRIDD